MYKRGLQDLGIRLRDSGPNLELNKGLGFRVSMQQENPHILEFQLSSLAAAKTHAEVAVNQNTLNPTGKNQKAYKT